MSPKIQTDNAAAAAELAGQVPSTRPTLSETSASYRLAFEDPDFIERPEARGIRFQLELLKADLILRENQVDHTIVVFGSARFVSREDAEHLVSQAVTDEEKSRAQSALINSTHYESAREFGQLAATYNLQQLSPTKRLHICTGGGPGVMAAANRGAHETGDLSIGLNITLPHEQHPNQYLTPALCFRFHYFALRKMHFLLRARAIVAYPGGYGSFDEIFEVLTLVQTRKILPMPVVLVGREFWKKIVRFDLLAEYGLIDPTDLDIISFVDSAEDAWKAIARWYQLDQSDNGRAQARL